MFWRKSNHLNSPDDEPQVNAIKKLAASGDARDWDRLVAALLDPVFEARIIEVSTLNSISTGFNYVA